MVVVAKWQSSGVWQTTELSWDFRANPDLIGFIMEAEGFALATDLIWVDAAGSAFWEIEVEFDSEL